MPASPPPDPILSETQVAFLESGVSINVASVSGDGNPYPPLARACGCQVSADRRQVAVLLSATQAAALFAGLRASGSVAVVFNLPSTHHSLQLKGRDARVTAPAADDPARAAAYRDAFAADLARIGFSDAYARAVIPPTDASLARVVFTPDSVFDQTPGGNAGQRLTRT